jgi:hypothetical protein
MTLTLPLPKLSCRIKEALKGSSNKLLFVAFEINFQKLRKADEGLLVQAKGD